MNSLNFKDIAQQLRKPEGEHGKQVAIKMNEGNAFINNRCIDALQLDAGDNVLEIGMGNGGFVQNIFNRENTITYFGCDFSDTMVEEARIINEALVRSGKAQFDVSSSGNLFFREHSFDAIFTVNTIYFWDDPMKYLQEIKRVLKHDGELLIALRPRSVMKTMPFVQYGFQLYEKEDIVELLTKSGFVVTKAIEEPEPDQEINGALIKMATLIVIAHVQPTV